MNRSRQILCVRRVLFKLGFWMMCTTLSYSQLLSPSFSFVPSLSLSPSLYSLLSLFLSLSPLPCPQLLHLSIYLLIPTFSTPLSLSLSLSLSLCLALYITVFSIRLSTYLFPSPSSYSELFSFCHSFCLLPISLLYIL